MTTSELKNNLLRIIDSIDNETVLSRFYLLISEMKDINDGDLWKSLTKEEQNELLLSDDESENENDLIPHSVIIKNHKL